MVVQPRSAGHPGAAVLASLPRGSHGCLPSLGEVEVLPTSRLPTVPRCPKPPGVVRARAFSLLGGSMNTVVDVHTIRKVAVESYSSVPTVAKYFDGGSLRPIVQARIEATLDRLKIARPKHRRGGVS